MTRLTDLISDGAHVPAVPLIGYPGVYLNGTTIKQNVHQADVHLSTLQAIHERFEPDGLFFLMDLSVEAGALGLAVRFPEMDSPTVVEHPVHELADLERLADVDVLADARLQSFVQTMRGMTQSLDTLLGAYVIGPFSLAGLLMGATEAVMASMLQPELLHATLRLATDVIVAYLGALEAAGAQMVAILEPSGSLLAPHQFDDFCGRYVKEVLTTMQSASILHICGQTTKHLEAMVATGAQGLSLDSYVDFPRAAECVPDELVLIGNLDTVTVMNQMDADEVYRTARDLVAEMKIHPNFVLSSACDLPLETPHENIDALVRAGKEAVR